MRRESVPTCCLVGTCHRDIYFFFRVNADEMEAGTIRT